MELFDTKSLICKLANIHRKGVHHLIDALIYLHKSRLCDDFDGVQSSLLARGFDVKCLSSRMVKFNSINTVELDRYGITTSDAMLLVDLITTAYQFNLKKVSHLALLLSVSECAVKNNGVLEIELRATFNKLFSNNRDLYISALRALIRLDCLKKSDRNKLLLSDKYNLLVRQLKSCDWNGALKVRVDKTLHCYAMIQHDIHSGVIVFSCVRNIPHGEAVEITRATLNAHGLYSVRGPLKGGAYTSLSTRVPFNSRYVQQTDVILVEEFR